MFLSGLAILSKLVRSFFFIIHIIAKREMFIHIFASQWLIIFLLSLVVICSLEPDLNCIPDVVNSLPNVDVKNKTFIVATILLQLLFNLEQKSKESI